jgi:archaellum component FlaG (FlaF/FlaG flagellin family)
MASKLKWGYATQADVDAGKLTKAQWEASKKALSKTESIFEKIGGDKAKLKIAILYGKGGTSSLKGGELGLSGTELGAVASAASVAAAIPVIVSIINALKESGIMKNDEAESALSMMNDPNTLKELEAGIDEEAASSNSNSNGDGSFFEKNKTALIVGGAVAVGGLALYLTNSKKSAKSKSGGLSGMKNTKRKPKTITLS